MTLFVKGAKYKDWILVEELDAMIGITRYASLDINVYNVAVHFSPSSRWTVILTCQQYDTIWDKTVDASEDVGEVLDQIEEWANGVILRIAQVELMNYKRVGLLLQ